MWLLERREAVLFISWHSVPRRRGKSVTEELLQTGTVLGTALGWLAPGSVGSTPQVAVADQSGMPTVWTSFHCLLSCPLGCFLEFQLLPVP